MQLEPPVNVCSWLPAEQEQSGVPSYDSLQQQEQSGVPSYDSLQQQEQSGVPSYDSLQQSGQTCLWLSELALD